MPCVRVFQDGGISRNERGSPMPRGSNQESIRGIGMELPGQAHAIQRDHRFDRAQVDSRGAEHSIYPNADIHRQPQPALGDEERDLPRRDG